MSLAELGMGPNPVVAAYQKQKALNEQSGLQQVQQAGAVMSLAQHVQAMQQEQELRGLLAKSGGDLEKARDAAVVSGNLTAAAHLAGILKEKRASDQLKMWSGAYSAPAAAANATPAAAPAQPVPGGIDFMAENNKAMGLPAPEAAPVATAPTGRTAMAKQYRDLADRLEAPLNQNPGLLTTPEASGVTRHIANLRAAAEKLDPAPKMHAVAPGGTLVSDSGDAVFTAPQKPTAETRPAFIKELETFNKMLPSDPGYAAMKARIARETAPTTAQVNLTLANNAIPAASAALHGDDFLKTLPAGEQTMVKSLAEGRLQMPSGFALRSPYWQGLLQKVNQYDPQFNAASFPQKLAVQKDFTSGPTSKNVTAINTAIGHMGTMSDLADAMKNNDVRAVNAVLNRIGIETGKTGVTNFNVAKSAVSTELMRVFRQVNASDAEIKDWADKFNSSNSPAQLNEALNVGANLLQSRIDALNDQWRRGMNTDKGFPNLMPDKNSAIMTKLGAKAGATAQPSALPSGDAIDAILRQRGVLK